MARFVLHFLDRPDGFTAVILAFDYLCVEQYIAFLEIYPRPSDAESFAASQSESAREHYCRIDRIVLCELQEREKFLLAVVLALKFVLLRAVDPVERVRVDQLVFERLLEGFSQDRVVVNDRVRDDSLIEKAVIESFDVLRLDRADRQITTLKVSADFAVDHAVVAVVCIDLQVLRGFFEPD